MFLKTENAVIGALGVTTGSGEILLDDEIALYGGDASRLARLKKATGLERRRVTNVGVTALDLGEHAAKRLLDSSGISARSLDALIFVTQTPDHFQPGNATILHGRLGLDKGVVAWDVNLGCSGWVYGVFQAASLVNAGMERVLLLAGDTISRQTNLRDRAVAPLFGDGVSATIIEKRAGATMSFGLATDGSGAPVIRVPAGGMRQPADRATAEITVDAEGNERSLEHLHLDGPEVFKFTLREIPGSIRELLAFGGLEPEQVNYYFLHQANGFILDTLRRQLKASIERVPKQALSRYGNLSSASVPSAICDELAEGAGPRNHCVCSGFGVGLSWGALLTDLTGARIFPVERYS